MPQQTSPRPGSLSNQPGHSLLAACPPFPCTAGTLHVMPDPRTACRNAGCSESTPPTPLTQGAASATISQTLQGTSSNSPAAASGAQPPDASPQNPYDPSDVNPDGSTLLYTLVLPSTGAQYHLRLPPGATGLSTGDAGDGAVARQGGRGRCTDLSGALASEIEGL